MGLKAAVPAPHDLWRGRSAHPSARPADGPQCGPHQEKAPRDQAIQEALGGVDTCGTRSTCACRGRHHPQRCGCCTAPQFQEAHSCPSVTASRLQPDHAPISVVAAHGHHARRLGSEGPLAIQDDQRWYHLAAPAAGRALRRPSRREFSWLQRCLGGDVEHGSHNRVQDHRRRAVLAAIPNHSRAPSNTHAALHRFQQSSLWLALGQQGCRVDLGGRHAVDDRQWWKHVDPDVVPQDCRRQPCRLSTRPVGTSRDAARPGVQSSALPWLGGLPHTGRWTHMAARRTGTRVGRIHHSLGRWLTRRHHQGTTRLRHRQWRRQLVPDLPEHVAPWRIATAVPLPKGGLCRHLGGTRGQTPQDHRRRSHLGSGCVAVLP